MSADNTVVSVINKIKDAVVTVYAEDEHHQTFASGSGFFIASNGIVVTNFHVLEGAHFGHIKDINGNEYQIESIIDYNPQHDLIKFAISNRSSKTFKFLRIANRMPQQGTSIVNYSNPLGSFANTASTGIVSALREMPEYGSVIQITAPISHGSSGSPVVNTQGEVVGVATFGYIEGQSLNFAVSGLQINKLTRSLRIPVSSMSRNEYETYRVKLAYRYEKSGKKDEAIRILGQEIASNPKNHLAYYYRALIEYRTDKIAEYLTDIKAAIELAPSNYQYAINNAVIMCNLMTTVVDQHYGLVEAFCEEVMGSINHVLSIDRTSSKAYYLLGKFYWEFFKEYKYKTHTNNMEFLQESFIQLSTSLNFGKDVEALILRGQVLSYIGKNGLAVIDCDDAIKLDPHNYHAYQIRGEIKGFCLNNYDDALLDYERAVDLARTNKEKADVLAGKATILEDRAFKFLNKQSSDDVFKALDCYKMAESLCPNSGYQQMYDELGKRLGKYMETHGNKFP